MSSSIYALAWYTEMRLLKVVHALTRINGRLRNLQEARTSGVTDTGTKGQIALA
jgi:hypothetical protein